MNVFDSSILVAAPDTKPRFISGEEVKKAMQSNQEKEALKAAGGGDHGVHRAERGGQDDALPRDHR